MTFDGWKSDMLELGYLTPAKRCRCDANMYPYAALGPFTSKFANHIKKCYNEGIENKLTIDEWLFVCYTSGINNPSEIGISMNKHHLSRIGDRGAYEIGNCRYILGKDNMKERDENGGSARGGNNRRGAANGMYGNTKYQGTNGALWSGYYHTPKGRFDTAKDASTANNISTATIIRYCKHQTRKKDISEDEYKTFCANLKESGWWFEEVKCDTKT
ncbi:hypothetical protein NVP3058O_109 [Vibrio phage 3.058.O._10N.286.46.B8]|nr:hypothetical protein NVP2058O_110 [Vibrio phage 2.058.O._10N.286.46.B8]AUS03179.1 hypothetical protein NVP3058O_109 [Vibrio phage 3.058.O._10N.286.46.B8]